MGDKQRLTRRAALGLMGGGAVTLAADTVGFGSVLADRSVFVDTADDPNGLLGLSGADGCTDSSVTLTNNATETVDVTVTTSAFRIDSPGSGTQTTFTLSPGDSQTVSFSSGSGSYDTVSFEATSQSGELDISYTRDLQLATLAEDTYTVEAKHSGRVMEANGSGNVIQGGYVGMQRNQRWDFTYNADCTFRIENRESGDVLAPPDGSEGSQLQVVSWSGADRERWRVTEHDDGTYRIENVATGYVVDVYGYSSDDGASIIQWHWKGANNDGNQSWHLRPGPNLAEVDTTPSGSASFDQDTLRITAGGRDMWEAYDEYGALVEENVEGDVVARVRVNDLRGTNIDEWAKAGIMFADDASTSGGHAGDVKVNVTPDHGFEMTWDQRRNDGMFDTSSTAGSVTYPCEIRITKSARNNGYEFTGEFSTDGGSTWTTIDQVNRNSANTTQDVALFACAVHAGQANETVTANFSRFTVV